MGGVLAPGKIMERNEQWLVAPPSWMTPEIKERVARLYQLESDTGISMPSLALRFVMADPAVTVVLIGAATVEEIEQNVEAARAGPLPTDIHQAIEDLVKEPETGAGD